jgi:hypothetical protein
MILVEQEHQLVRVAEVLDLPARKDDDLPALSQGSIEDLVRCGA